MGNRNFATVRGTVAQEVEWAVYKSACQWFVPKLLQSAFQNILGPLILNPELPLMHPSKYKQTLHKGIERALIRVCEWVNDACRVF